MKNYYLAIIAACSFSLTQAQMTATFDQTVNTLCDGSNCSYTGPSILINELMITPQNNDGCLSGTGGPGICRGEWIELYNPNLCEPINISCYFLGNHTAEGTGGYTIPTGTIIPPGGFCLIRGENAAPVPTNLLVTNGGNVVELVVSGSITSAGVCAGGTRLWFPNVGGWFAFYDESGVPQDAVSWANQENIADAPCVASLTGCNTGTVTLSSYNNIAANRKNLLVGSGFFGTIEVNESFRRIPDGGSWDSQGTATYGSCNDVCATVSTSTCDGTATVNPSGGSGNYTYEWDDSQAQLTQTAIELCAGTYTVVVTDTDDGSTETFSVIIEDFVPAVSLVIDEELCDYGQTVPMSDISTFSPTPSSGQTGTFSGTGITGSDFDASVSGDGTFPITYTFTDENGCNNNSDVSDLIVHPSPEAQISGLASEYCLADSTVDLTLSPLGGVLTGAGITNSQFNVDDAGVGTHDIKYVVVNQFGCEDSTIFTVTVHPNPTFTLDITSATCNQSDGEIIINTNVGSAPFDYSIDDGLTTQISNTFSNLSAGPYEVVVTDDNGCVGEMDTIISTTGVIDPSFTFTDFCEGETSGPSNIASTGGVFSFVSPTSDGATINPSTGVISNGVGGTTYTVQHVTNGICPGTATEDVTVHTVPNLNFGADPIEGMPPLIVNFTNNSTGADNYTWVFGDGTSQQNNNTNVSHVFNFEGVFTTLLIGETNNGMCVDTAAISITVLFPIINYTFPNVFTPNGDNSNDNFKFVYHENINSINIIILNRWGNLVFESDDPNFNWNGNINNSGAECLDGTYFYKAELTNFAGDEIQEHGFVQLNRGE